jgi:Raf kinase inhibitor-like YbhB/YbcL family protein
MVQPLIVSLDFLEFPPEHTLTGGNRSPRITISGPQAVSVAVMVFNPFIKACCSFTPWIIWNLPAGQVIPAGIPCQGSTASPVPAVQGTNDYGTVGYSGPDPPPGETHRYLFRVYALDTVLDLAPGSGKHELIAAMRGHVLAYGETAAICSR